MDLRELILSIDDKKRVPVVIPEWPSDEAPGGITVYATSMNAARQAAYVEASKAYPTTPGNILLVVFSAENEQGDLIFKPEDIPALQTKNTAAIRRVFVAADDLTPSTEDIRKNLQAPR